MRTALCKMIEKREGASTDTRKDVRRHSHSLLAFSHCPSLSLVPSKKKWRRRLQAYSHSEKRKRQELALLLLFMPLPVPSFLSLTPISSSSWGEGLFISPKRDSTALIAAQLSWTPVPIFRTRKGTKKYICLTHK